jgi:hypothetical protein
MRYITGERQTDTLGSQQEEDLVGIRHKVSYMRSAHTGFNTQITAIRHNHDNGRWRWGGAAVWSNRRCLGM